MDVNVIIATYNRAHLFLDRQRKERLKGYQPRFDLEFRMELIAKLAAWADLL